MFIVMSKEVVDLQSGSESSLKAWNIICEKSRVEFRKIYDLLGVSSLIERGESFYNPFLQDIGKAFIFLLSSRVFRTLCFM